MKGFIDIHTHILPGVDDGAPSMEAALALIDAARQNGTRFLFLTPHYRGKFKKNTPEDLLAVFHQLQTQVQAQWPDMLLFLGQEIYCEVDAPERLASGQIMSLNGSHYALLEFRPATVRSDVIRGVSETIFSGFVPIIAHAERYDVFRKDATLLEEVLHMGSLIQLNVDSIMGGQGFAVKRFCHKLLSSRKAHFVASDAHDMDHRPPLLRDCFLRICKKYGNDYARKLFYENPLAVVNHQDM